MSVDTSNERLLWAKQQFVLEHQAYTLGDPVWKYELLEVLIDEVIELRRYKSWTESNQFNSGNLLINGEPFRFTYGERWQGDQVRYEIHDQYSRTWINGLPIKEMDWKAVWERLFQTEQEAQKEIRMLEARFHGKEGKPDGMA